MSYLQMMMTPSVHPNAIKSNDECWAGYRGGGGGDGDDRIISPLPTTLKPPAEYYILTPQWSDAAESVSHSIRANVLDSGMMCDQKI